MQAPSVMRGTPDAGPQCDEGNRGWSWRCLSFLHCKPDFWWDLVSVITREPCMSLVLFPITPECFSCMSKPFANSEQTFPRSAGSRALETIS